MHCLTQELRQNPDLYVLLLRASQDWESLSEEERSIVHLWNVDEASLYETAWILWREGAIDDITYKPPLNLLRRRLFPRGFSGLGEARPSRRALRSADQKSETRGPRGLGSF